MAPRPGETVQQARPTLHWNNVGATSYDIQYANNPDFFIPENVENIADTFYRVDLKLDNGQYSWRIRPAGGEYSPAYSFTVMVEKATGTVAFDISPSGDVYIDEALVRSGISSAEMPLDEGQHRIRVVNEDAVNKEFSDNIVISPDTLVALSYTFRMPSATPPPVSRPKPADKLGELRVGSRPTIGADIYIDNELQSRKTPTAFRLKPGLHVVRAVLVIDGVTHERTDSVNISSGGSDRIMFDFEN
jgi:hypothetical protein